VVSVLQAEAQLQCGWVGVVSVLQDEAQLQCGWVGVVSVVQAEAQVVLQPATRIPLQPNHNETPTHIEPRKYDQCDNSTE